MKCIHFGSRQKLTDREKNNHAIKTIQSFKNVIRKLNEILSV